MGNNEEKGQQKRHPRTHNSPSLASGTGRGTGGAQRARPSPRERSLPRHPAALNQARSRSGLTHRPRAPSARTPRPAGGPAPASPTAPGSLSPAPPRSGPPCRERLWRSWGGAAIPAPPVERPPGAAGAAACGDAGTARPRTDRGTEQRGWGAQRAAAGAGSAGRGRQAQAAGAPRRRPAGARRRSPRGDAP